MMLFWDKTIRVWDTLFTSTTWNRAVVSTDLLRTILESFISHYCTNMSSPMLLRLWPISRGKLWDEETEGCSS